MSSSIIEFNIQPNGAFQAGKWLWVICGLVVFSVGIAIRLALMGFWLVLPFAVLDVLCVSLVALSLQRKARYLERIRIMSQEVEVLHLEKGNNASWSFPLYWAQVNLVKPRHRWYPHRLVLGASGKWVEVGKCLTEDEREALAVAIRREIGIVKQEALYA